MMPSVQLAPTRLELVPWTDRRGRFHPLRAIVFALLIAPAAWLGLRAALDMLGPKALNAAIHSTGYWTIWPLLASLCVTPFRALAARPDVVVIRRMVGNAALAYALLHLVLYALDQNLLIIPIVTEIALRFYLTIGFIGLLGLVALGLTSTDGWCRYLGPTWKRLHRVVYAIAVLGLVHYILQSKLDVSAAIFATGVFAWLMIWRILPIGRDRDPITLVILALAAAVLTLGIEWAWYRFGTRLNPMKVVLAEFDIEYGLNPAGRVLFAGLVAALATELVRRAATPFGQTAAFSVLMFTLAGLALPGTALFMGWSLADTTPPGIDPAVLTTVWVALMALLGLARHGLRTSRQRRWIDALAIAALMWRLALTQCSDPSAPDIAPVLAGTGMALALLAAGLVASSLRAPPRAAALLIVPAALLLAWEATALL